MRIGDYLYRFSTMHGVQALRVSGAGAPRLAGRAPFFAEPLSIAAAGKTVFALGTKHGQFAPCDTCPGKLRGSYGAALGIIDVTRPETPVLRSTVPLEGEVRAGWIVGRTYFVLHSYGLGAPEPLTYLQANRCV